MFSARSELAIAPEWTLSSQLEVLEEQFPVNKKDGDVDQQSSSQVVSPCPNKPNEQEAIAGSAVPEAQLFVRFCYFLLDDSARATQPASSLVQQPALSTPNLNFPYLLYVGLQSVDEIYDFDKVSLSVRCLPCQSSTGAKLQSAVKDRSLKSTGLRICKPRFATLEQQRETEEKVLKLHSRKMPVHEIAHILGLKQQLVEIVIRGQTQRVKGSVLLQSVMMFFVDEPEIAELKIDLVNEMPGELKGGILGSIYYPVKRLLNKCEKMDERIDQPFLFAPQSHLLAQFKLRRFHDRWD